MRSLPVLSSRMSACLVLATVSCATTRGSASEGGSTVTIEGVVASIDTQPWTYDGHAVVQVDVVGRGRVAVQLPARWNLCQAAPVDVQALAVGTRVQAVGSAEGDGAITVCSDAAHRLVPL
ncbi:hypothetical protein [Stenotrophomonas sp. Marseille-Q4652]|uniref:hypothetical protein n=1 Tax=Stenotrophomonas sp. Marseille-Q4652 TaxID=2866595 RepID=UPI001CE407E6|nr:hypothetical protein [Stenotrophomonas sp. Marseille-Q4652]